MKAKILFLVLAMASFSSALFSQKLIVQHSGLPASNNPNLVFSAVNPDVNVPGTSGTYAVISSGNIGAPEPTVSGSSYITDYGQSWTVIDDLPHWIPSCTTRNVGWSSGDGDIIYKLASTYNDIVPAGSTVKKLSSNQFNFTEGPVWYGDSILLFTSYISSNNTSQINSYNPIENKFRIFRNNINANGLTLDMNKNLLSTEGSRVVMLDGTGVVTKVMAAIYNNKPFNGPNDLIADGKGGIYFSDPVYFVTPSQDKESVYYIDPTGNVKRIIEDLAKPNGLILSPNGTKLYVVDSDNKYLYSWDVAPDGSVSGKLSLAELQTKSGIASGADGMAIDIYGNIYVSSDIGVQIFSPDGVAITTLLLPEKVTNCDFGGTDFKTLYITVATNLYSIDLNYPGYAVSRNAIPLGITQIPDKPMIKVYPNPVTDILHVQLKTDKASSFEILGMDGKTESVNLKNNVGKNLEVNTQDLKPGIYILRVTNGEGVLSGKFIKK